MTDGADDEKRRWLVVPGEMLAAGGKAMCSPGTPKLIPALICLELDAETARAAGWVMPS